MKEILAPGRNCWGIYGVSECGILIDGRNYFRAFYRAAARAEKYILISGWQFDSTVKLLRGKDLKEDPSADVTFLTFLTSLCESRTDLHIYILAWDYSVIFAHEREWFQEWIFKWSGHGRLQFVFDDKHPVGGTHHQKFVVIDGAVGFVGGIDLCSFRWDDRNHLYHNDQRMEGGSGRSYDPYHDLQAYCRGAVCTKLAEIFQRRWLAAVGRSLDLPPPHPVHPPVAWGEPIKGETVAVSRTVSPTISSPQEPIREIRALYLDAIAAARCLIYIENQYFSSTAIYQALKERMQRPGEKPEIVMVLPKKPQALSEKVVHGVPQMRMMQALKRVAAETGTQLGIYYVATRSPDCKEKMVYIHSKLLIVDDRFLTVGSANTTNRSMGLDTELNMSWEACSPDQRQLAASIRRIRVSLLAEHIGLSGWRVLRRVRTMEGLVQELDNIADRSGSRLQRHPLDTLNNGSELLRHITPPFVDSERAILDESAFELLTSVDLLLGGLADFNSWLRRKTKDQSGAVLFKGKGGPEIWADGHQTSLSDNRSLQVILWLAGISLLVFMVWLFWNHSG